LFYNSGGTILARPAWLGQETFDDFPGISLARRDAARPMQRQIETCASNARHRYRSGSNRT
jgi:hypothetical protein